jgi:hypothetical protein
VKVIDCDCPFIELKPHLLSERIVGRYRTLIAEFTAFYMAVGSLNTLFVKVPGRYRILTAACIPLEIVVGHRMHSLDC